MVSAFTLGQPPFSTSSPYASISNPYGVAVPPFKGTQPAGSIAFGTKTYHGLSIIFNGAPVGRINNWQPNMYSRNGTHIFEVGSLSWGRPVDYAPGNGSNYTLTCSRTELWGNEIELAAGFATPWTDLVSQKDPFTITETLFQGAQPYRVWSYGICWFTERVEQAFEAEGTAIVIVNATIAFVSRLRTL